eukprot:Ihof_evm1s909 gene=Ihof_evmTU1s909
MEKLECDEKDVPKTDVIIKNISVFVNPFADLQQEKEAASEKEKEEKKK